MFHPLPPEDTFGRVKAMVDITDDIMECLTDRDLENAAKRFFEMDSGQGARIPDSIVKVWLGFIRENGLSIEALPLDDPTIEAIGRKFGRPIGDRLVDWPTHGVLVEGTAKLEKKTGWKEGPFVIVEHGNGYDWVDADVCGGNGDGEAKKIIGI